MGLQRTAKRKADLASPPALERVPAARAGIPFVRRVFKPYSSAARASILAKTVWRGLNIQEIAAEFPSTVPARCGRPLPAWETAMVQPRSPSRALKAIVEGRSSGDLNSTDAVNASGRRAASAARQRAFNHMPWAMARRKPNNRAASGLRWIGLTSPEIAA